MSYMFLRLLRLANGHTCTEIMRIPLYNDAILDYDSYLLYLTSYFAGLL